jgi:aminoglycoside/choline kinase family phosphotransferase
MSSPEPASAAAPVPVSWPDPAREQVFNTWLASLPAGLGLQAPTLRAASADASFRRYLRLDTADGASLIVMDAPPAQEDCRPFVHVARLLGQAGLKVPEVLAWDEANGFMLLPDLGSTTYLAALGDIDTATPAGLKQVDGLYHDAIDTLVRMQVGGAVAQAELPPYDRALMARELQLFPDWYVARHCGVTLTDEQQKVLDHSFEAILRVCLEQPMGLVHRDFHSRNLMVQPDQPGTMKAPARPGVLDFQDAVWGPLAYDLVSLLRDAYVDWDEAVQIDWAVRYWERARKAGVPVPDDFGNFWRDVEWMGLQRHLKVLGIFCRLNYRDGKAAYLNDLPRVWRQAHHVAERYSVLRPLSRLLEDLGGVQVKFGYTF